MPAASTEASDGSGQISAAEPAQVLKSTPELLPRRPSRSTMLRDLVWLWSLFVRAAPRHFGGWTAVALVLGLLVPVQLWLTKNAIDSLALELRGGDGNRTVLWLALLVASLLFDRAISGLQPWLEAATRERTCTLLQQRAMAKASALELVSFEHQEYYDQVNRVASDIETRIPLLLERTFMGVQVLPQMLGYAVALTVLTPWLTVAVVIAVVPVILLFAFSGQTNWSLLFQQTRERRLADYYTDLLVDRRFAKEVKLYGLSKYLSERWTSLFWRTRNEQRRLAFRLGLQQRGAVFGMQVVMMLGLVWVVFARLIHASPGGYVLLFQSLLGLVDALFNLNSTIQSLGENSGYASEFRAFTEQPVERGAIDNSSKDMRGSLFPVPLRRGIRFENVWFAYPGSQKYVLKGVSFEIRAGEKVALVGENGAGKTTITKLLLGLYSPDKGKVTADGVDYSNINPVSLRGEMSAVFQQFTHYHLTLGDNVALGRIGALGDARRVRSAVERAGALDVVRSLRDDYDTLLGPDVGGVDLSGGQWQRIALARAFFRDAQILVLDEPTAALDPLAELALFTRFAELTEDRTALLVSHRLGMARLADRVLVVSEGQLVEHGTHDELMAKGGEYAAMFESQARWYR